MWNIIWSFVKEQNLINALRENFRKVKVFRGSVTVIVLTI